MSIFTRASLTYRGLVALATIVLLVVGALVIPSFKQEVFPSLTYPALTVITPYTGASPDSVEKDITAPLENALQGLQGVQQVTSYSSTGASTIQLMYNYGTDLQQAQQKLESTINSTKAALPTTSVPQVLSYNVSDYPIMQLAATSDLDQTTLASNLQRLVIPKLQGISNVARADVTGVRQQIVQITLDPQKLQARGLGMQDVQNALQSNNIETPSGQLTDNDTTVPIRVGNTFSSLQDLQTLVVGSTKSSPAGPPAGSASSSAPHPVELQDVAMVQQVLAPSTSLTRTNGQPSLGIGITKSPDGNAVAISQQVRALLPTLERQLGHHTHLSVVSDSAPYVQASIQDLVREGLIGAGFAILVILVFLFSLRSTLVTAVSIPLSIVVALIGLWAGNYSLNLLTLGGLTIAVGRVVDDSIVVLENIYRHLNRGEEKKTAIVAAVKEVAGAVTASTITTVSVFLPIGLAGGLVGELFLPFSLAITVALLASLFIALTVIPVLAYWFLKTPKEQLQQKEEQTSWLERGYVSLMQWATHRPAIVLVGALVVLIGSFALSGKMATNVLGNSGENTFTITQTLPAGSSLPATDRAAQQVEAILKTNPDIQSYQVVIGSSSSGDASTNVANFSVTTQQSADQTRLQENIRKQLDTLHNAGAIQLQSGGLFGSTIQAYIQAPDTQTLQQVSQQVYNVMVHTPHTANVTSNLSAALPFIDVHVDPRKAQSHGLSATVISQLVSAAYNGTTVMQVTIQGEGEEIQLFQGQAPANITELQKLQLPTLTGPVALQDVATISEQKGPTQITHINGTLTSIVSATATSADFGAVSSDVQNRINTIKLPSGVSISMQGDTAQQSQAFTGMAIALLIAILLVYITMVVTFKSILQPLLLLVSIPFAATGSILLLVITQTPLGLPALIGLLMLVGIVVTNAIVLLDFVNQYRKKGADIRTAVIEGGRHRLRPILMTALATIFALLPMALNVEGSSGFISQPLAVVVIGGLASSTLLTLLVVPTLYVLVESIRERIQSRNRDNHLEQPAREEQNAVVASS